MRRTTRLVTTVGAAATVIAALSAASLPPSAGIRSVQTTTMSAAAHHDVARSRSDVRPTTDAATTDAAVQDAASDRAELAKASAARVARAAAAAKQARAAAASPSHTVHVWTTGFQAQVNECRGGVDMSARYGMRIVGEHWSCGGSSFPTASGAIVRFTGLDAGTYRVIGLVATLSAYTAHTYQVPHNYPLLYQTCRGGDSHFTEFIALAKVG